MATNDHPMSPDNRLLWLIQDAKIDPKIFFDFSAIFWPVFMQKDNYIILELTFSEEKYQGLIKHKRKVEYWMNLFTVDDYFDRDADGQQLASKLSHILVDMWHAKLKNEFPDREFEVKYQCDIEYGDFGLTFYQTNIG